MQMLPFGFARQNQSLFFHTLFYNYYVYRLNFIKAIIFAHFTCIAHMFTSHNFKMLYVYIDDIMSGLHASDLVVLMEVSQTTL